MNLKIKTVRTIPEYRRVEQLQALVWGHDPERDHQPFVIPLHALLTTHKNGGIILGAWDGDGSDPNNMIAFIQGYAGLLNGRNLHVSNMLGVLEAYRDTGIGFQLKLAQREAAKALGLDWMVWTVDPLQSRNANLNHRKLGAVCRRYLLDHYGELESDTHSGLPTDRFEVDWMITSRWVEQLLQSTPNVSISNLLKSGAHMVILTQMVAGEFLAPTQVNLEGQLPSTVVVEIPPDIGQIMKTDMGLAQAWRQATREAFTTLFAANFTVIDFLSERTSDSIGRRSMYMLRRNFQIS